MADTTIGPHDGRLEREESSRESLAAELDKLFEASRASSGHATYSRDSLHERGSGSADEILDYGQEGAFGQGR